MFVNSYSPQSMWFMTFSSPSIVKAFLIIIGTSIGGGGICATICGSSYGSSLCIQEAKDKDPLAACCRTSSYLMKC